VRTAPVRAGEQTKQSPTELAVEMKGTRAKNRPCGGPDASSSRIAAHRGFITAPHGSVSPIVAKRLSILSVCNEEN